MSKTRLSELLGDHDIAYEHRRALGTPPDLRWLFHAGRVAEASEAYERHVEETASDDLDALAGRAGARSAHRAAVPRGRPGGLSSPPRGRGAAPAAARARRRGPLRRGSAELERGLHAAEVERLLEAVERHAQADERLERLRASARGPRSRCSTPASQSTLWALTLPQQRRGSGGPCRRRAPARRCSRRARRRRAPAGTRRRCAAAATPRRASPGRRPPPRSPRRSRRRPRPRPPAASPRWTHNVAPSASTSRAFSPPGERPAVQTSRSSSRSRHVASIPIAPAPITSARRGAHGWRAADRARVAQAALADRGRLGQHAEAAERLRHGDEVLRRLGHELARVAVQPGDPALAVVARVAGVGRAPPRTPRSCPHERRTVPVTRSPRSKPWPVALDDAEQLVAEHEPLLAFGRHAEQPLGDLAVGPADADLERAQQQLAAGCLRLGDVGDLGRVRLARRGDERLHVRPR